MKKFILATSLLVLTMIAGRNTACAQATPRIMVTYAGTGISGFSGDWGSGRAAKVAYPHDVCMDAAQNIYFVDETNDRIRKISTANGVITTIAGGGTSPADGIPATSASIVPNYMCIDASGNLYVTTTNRIQQINLTTGIITTVAGNGTAGAAGDGGPATAANLNDPEGICIDASGNLYIVDNGNYEIRKITASTGIISTIAGNGIFGYSGDGAPATSALLSSGFAIAVDASGNVFFSDWGGALIREIVAATGLMEPFAGIGGSSASAASGGMADTTSIGEIMGIYIDSIGDLYCDDGSCSCVKIQRSSGRIYLEAGSLASDGYNGDDRNAINDWLNIPGGLWLDPAGNIFIADANNNRMRKAIQLTTTPTFAFGKAQYINACSSGPTAVDSQLTITELDSAQAETWTVISVPTNGTMSGFPYTALSLGTSSVLTPGGLNYTPLSGYTGLDSFRVQVSNGTLSDMVTVYLAIGAGNILGTTRICAGTTTLLTDGIMGGTWSESNTDVTLADGSITAVSGGNDVIQYGINTTCGLATVASTVTVDMTAPSTAGTIAGPASVCPGASITLTDATSAGVWSASNPGATVTTAGMVSGVTAGSDTVVYSVTNGCGSIATSEIITINPEPDPGTITGSVTTVCAGSTIIMTDGVAGGVWSLSNPGATVTIGGMVSGFAAGTDTLLYTVTNGCGSLAASEVITINPEPDAGTIASGETTMCAGSTITLTDGATGGVWSLSNPGATVTTAGVVSGITAGADTVAYTVSNVCGSVVASEVITINPLPDAGTITAGETTVCIGSSMTLTDGATGGVWSAENGHATVTSDGVVTGVTPGTDNILYSVTNTCGTATANESVVANVCTTGVTKIASTPGISLFPNPAAYSLNVLWEALQPGNATVVITDVTSREVLNTGMFDNNNGTGATQLNIANLAEGVYFLTFDSESAHYTSKFVVSK